MQLHWFMSGQIEIFAIPSPCQRICETDRLGYCKTCYRSREERFNWLKYNNEEKWNVLRLCRQRYLRKRYHDFQQIKVQQKSVKNDNQLDLF